MFIVYTVNCVIGDTMEVLSANWHVTEKCNYKCKFCFAQDAWERRSMTGQP